ncbi:MAG: HAD family hydrolase [Pseudonocardia sp.]|nr:HAD family hydrolase [Pseudonocardia sp.]
MPAIELICLDMSGTTVRDDGAVEQAFISALAEVGIAVGSARYAEALEVIRATMGQAKIEVLRLILRDEFSALRANKAFEKAYAKLLADGAVDALPGAEQLLGQLRAAGLRICLTTGFAPATREALIDRLNWGRRIDLALSPVEAGRGRPWPDMIITAARYLEISGMSAVAVAGDTPNDIRAGLAAGASIVAGVLSGSGTRSALTEAGATHVLDTVGELLPIVVPVG